ncbi:MAG: hypothetical protein LBC12_06005 [Nitrososphaerota archaeon]|nr:hypothetical protein [Nitrososphaerota archaeon]
MTHARAGLGVVTVDEKIYAIGGYAVNESYEYVGTTERYDPKTDTWVTLTPMPTPRGYFAIVAYEDKIYCIGGEEGVSRVRGRPFRVGGCVNEVYDTATNSWSTKASMPLGGADLQAGVVDGKIFVINGCDLHMYDPIANFWTNKTRMPATPAMPASLVSAVVDDKIVVIGIFTIFNLGFEYEGQRIMVYDPKIDMWSEGNVSYIQDISKRSWTAGGAAGATSGLYAPQKVYFIMFTSDFFYEFTSSNMPALQSMTLYNTTTIMYNRVYDPISGVWLTMDVPTIREGFGVAVVDDLLYVIGGWCGGEISSLNEQYVPIGYHGTLSSNTKFSLTNKTTVAVVILILTIGIIGGLFFYLKERKKLRANE